MLGWVFVFTNAVTNKYFVSIYVLKFCRFLLVGFLFVCGALSSSFGFSQVIKAIPVVDDSAVAGDATHDIAWAETFDVYKNNQYSIRIPFSSENLATLKKRRLIYRFRLIYISLADLDKPGDGFIHVGFFGSKQDAEGLKKDSSFLFPDQTVQHVSLKEHKAVTESITQSKAGVVGEYYVLAMGPNVEDEFDRVSKNILNSAKEEYIKHNYRAAAAQYQLLVALADDPELVAWATELIGLCQEKQKKFADAIDTYKKLMEDFPEASGFARVEQRHRGLTTAASDELGDLRTTKAEGKRKIFTRGVFGQTYRGLSREVNDEPAETVSSLVATDFDVRTSAQWDGHYIKARVNGLRIDDLLNEEGEDDDTQTRIRRLYVDYRHNRTGTNATFGRIKDYDSGVFTSYDGATISYPVLDDIRVALSVGVPVYFSDLYDDLDYLFFSAHASWEVNKQWRLNSYFTNQTLNGTTDRRALGTRAQYYNKNLSSSLNIDYDLAFSELNNFLWTGAYSYKEKTNISATIGRQRSPFLSATNILIGQPDLDLDLYLETQDNEDTLLDDALARTSLNQYYTLSLNQKLTSELQINLDYTQSTLSDIPSLDVLLGAPVIDDAASSFDYSSYGAQLIVQKFFVESDAATFGFRSTSSDSSDANQVYFYERLRAGSSFFVQPKVSYTEAKVVGNDADQQIWRYSFSLIYRPWRTTELNVEAGQEIITTGVDVGRSVSTYIFAGYRVNF